MKKRQQQDPLTKLKMPRRGKRSGKMYTIASDALSDRIPNDWLEAVVILVALVALSGGAYTLYSLSQMMG